MITKSSAKEAEFDERVLKIAHGNDEFEGYQNPHAARIADLADVIAQKLNFASEDRRSLRQAALIHDIGMPMMNRKYIKSAHPLNHDERLDMQRHTIIGEQEAAKRGFNRAVQLLVRWHHEWWNGAGYPDALERERIPMTAAILRVADTYVSMIDARPYRTAVSTDEAKKYLTHAAGIEFAPQIVKIFLSLKIAENPTAQFETDTETPEISQSFSNESFSAINPS